MKWGGGVRGGGYVIGLCNGGKPICVLQRSDGDKRECANGCYIYSIHKQRKNNIHYKAFLEHAFLHNEDKSIINSLVLIFQIKNNKWKLCIGVHLDSTENEFDI